MPMDFESLYGAYGVPVIADWHASAMPLKYRKPGSSIDLEWKGVRGPVRTVRRYTPHGEEVLETKTWQIDRRLTDRDGVMHPEVRATVEDADGQWIVNVDECVWGETFVTLALMRAPQTAGNELRRGAV